MVSPEEVETTETVDCSVGAMPGGRLVATLSALSEAEPGNNRGMAKYGKLDMTCEMYGNNLRGEFDILVSPQ